MKLIMSGGGDSSHFVDLDQKFLSQLSAEPSLLFVPLAGEPDGYSEEMERIVEVFSSIDFSMMHMVTDLNELDWSFLENFDAVYLDGGNTFRLMEQIRRSHFYELLHRFLWKGGIVNGDSAGAIIMGSHLETAHFGDYGDENESGLICYQGLSLLGSWAVHCHYELAEDQQISNFVKDFGFPVMALHEEAGVFIENGVVKVIGEAPVSFFHSGPKKTVSPGDHFSLF